MMILWEPDSVSDIAIFAIWDSMIVWRISLNTTLYQCLENIGLTTTNKFNQQAEKLRNALK